MPGPQELLIIVLVALFVLGPERLPGIARSAARGLAKLRDYGVSASKELRGVADLGEIEREVSNLRRELARTRADLRRAMHETVASSPSSPTQPLNVSEPTEGPVIEVPLQASATTGDDTGDDTGSTGDTLDMGRDSDGFESGGEEPSSPGA